MNKQLCVIGSGRWGQNHIKTLRKLGCLAAVVDANSNRVAEVIKNYPDIKVYTNIEDAISAKYDGYTLATPAETHYQIAKLVIEAGLNILIEKPMTLTSIESESLINLSQKSGSRVMVGHVLLFHPAINKIKEIIESGRLGKLNYIYSNRLNLGTVRTEESVFSSFAPHDISVVDYLVGKPVINIEAKGSKFLQKDVFDSTIALLEYPENVHAHIFVSWLHPFKQQLLVVVGSKAMISFDDATPEKKIFIYNKGFEFENGTPIKIEEADEEINYDKKMPLEEEIRYFINNLDKTIEINSGQDGYEVVKILETVQSLIE
ncbi:MAG: Gfo/Idh/MocA family oxidoreductase, partial [Bacteroidales bacterium]